MKPIDRLVNSNVRCTKCGAKGIGTCNCWVQCGCGWTKARLGKCNNKNCNQTKSEA